MKRVWPPGTNHKRSQSGIMNIKVNFWVKFIYLYFYIRKIIFFMEYPMYFFQNKENFYCSSFSFCSFFLKLKIVCKKKRDFFQEFNNAENLILCLNIFIFSQETYNLETVICKFFIILLIICSDKMIKIIFPHGEWFYCIIINNYWYFFK